jgi:cytochrome c oxidase subunit 2
VNTVTSFFSGLRRGLSARSTRVTALCGVLFLALSPVLGAQDAVTKRWGPTPVASFDGHRVDELFMKITVLVSISFAIMLILLITPAIKHRARPGHKAHFDHGTSLKDKRFTAIVSLVVFIVLDAYVLIIAMTDLREVVYNFPLTKEGAFRVEVSAQQWAWNFRTAGPDGEFGTADDIVSINELHVPNKTPVVFNLASKDVIHALFLPDMRIKRDINPGAINRVWFEPAIAGTYDILCAELCGFAHYQMHGRLFVHEQDDYEAWQQEAGRIATMTYDDNDTEAQWAWDWKE